MMLNRVLQDGHRLTVVMSLTNIPSPYRVKFFNELGTKCDLTVVFEKRSSSERDEVL